MNLLIRFVNTRNAIVREVRCHDLPVPSIKYIALLQECNPIKLVALIIRQKREFWGQ
jgi:hypothetical protein